MWSITMEYSTFSWRQESITMILACREGSLIVISVCAVYPFFLRIRFYFDQIFESGSLAELVRDRRRPGNGEKDKFNII
jgi:hypothetical protein